MTETPVVVETPIVYVAHQPSPGPDGRVQRLAEAAEWGEIRFVTTEEERPGLRSKSILQQVRTRLALFRPEVDFVAWIGGDPAGLILTAATLADMGYRDFLYLRWERSQDPITGRRTGKPGFVRQRMTLLPFV